MYGARDFHFVSKNFLDCMYVNYGPIMHKYLRITKCLAIYSHVCTNLWRHQCNTKLILLLKVLR